MRRILLPAILLLISFSGIPVSGFAQPYYIATNGSDTNSGTQSSPFRTIEQAVSVVRQG